MNELGSYIFRICAAALLCAVTQKICSRDKVISTVVQTVSGLFLVFTLLSPLGTLRPNIDIGVFDELTAEAQQAAAQGEAQSRNYLAQCIKEQTEAYILDKARGFGADVEVAVTLSADAWPSPVGVTVSGTISPYVKQQLMHCIEDDLGIRGEDQIWTRKG